MRFRAEQHLRRQTDIRAVREQGRRIDCRAFTLWYKRRATASEGVKASPTSRICVIASTAAVGGAVQRNRAKRRLRELYRSHQQLVPSDCDLLLIARSAATTTDLGEMGRKFGEACAQLSKS